MSLFAACLYAAFAQGATRPRAELGLQLAIALISDLAALALLRQPRRPRLTRRAGVALGLLGAFTLWSLLTLAWSADPPGTWTELNRLVTYGLVLALAILFAGTARDGLDRTARALFALAMCVTLDALGQKVVPGLHIGGLINLNRTGQIARLQGPLDYWNALALLVVLGAPSALTLVLEGLAGRHRGRALTGLVGLELIVVTVGFSESRGGFLALAVALAVAVGLSPDRLVTLGAAALACGAGALDLAIGLSASPLANDGVSLAVRERAGVLLLLVLIAVATLSALLLPALAGLPGRLTVARRRRVWRQLGYGTLALLILALAAAVLSAPGLGGEIRKIWASFTNVSIPTSGTRRLLSVSSANRAAWWGQALRAFAARPFGGWGAGSFAEINLLFRHTPVSVQDAHSVPLQWLAETGLPGAALALGAWSTLLGAGIATVRRARARIDPTRLDTAAARRCLAGIALFAAAAAYSIHALYDWDWDIPGVTLPVLVALGVLAGVGDDPVAVLALPRWAGRGTLVEVPELRPRPASSPTLRLLGLATITIALCLFAVSALAPVIASDQVDVALADAGRGTSSGLSAAEQAAGLASVLNPLSAAGPAAEADVAVARGRPALARDELISAVRRQPTDESAWTALLAVDLSLRDGAGALQAAQRVLALNPRPAFPSLLKAAAGAASAEIDMAPPRDSATAEATPGH